MTPSGKERRITFAADDLGASRGVNQGILEACLQGPVRRVSLLVTGFALEEAAQALRSRPHLERGLHFSLTLGRPLSRGGRRLAQGEEVFPPAEVLLRRCLLGRLDPEQVREEMEAQWEALLQAGIQPAFLDGHQHVHLFPGVRQVLAEFLEDHGVERTRILEEPLLLPPRRRLLPRLLLGGFSRRTRALLAARGIEPEERSAGLCLWQAPDLEEALATLLAALPPGRWEIFTHPRRPDGDFDRLDPESRKGPDPGLRELALLTHPAFLRRLEAWGILPPPLPPGSGPTGPTSG